MFDRPLTLVIFSILTSYFAFGNSCVIAQNNFLPHDAYFPFCFTINSLQDLRPLQGEPPSFKYNISYDRELLMAHPLGFSEVKIRDFDDFSWSRLLKATLYLRDTCVGGLTQEKREHFNKSAEFQCLVYSKSFAPGRFQLGLRYNEQWVEDIDSFDQHASKVWSVFEPLDSPTAVEESWGKSSRVDSLEVQFPVKPWSASAHDHPPVIIGQTRLVLVPPVNLKNSSRAGIENATEDMSWARVSFTSLFNYRVFGKVSDKERDSYTTLKFIDMDNSEAVLYGAQAGTTNWHPIRRLEFLVE